MEIYEPGTVVWMAEHSIRGMIDRVTISDIGTQYEVAWFTSGVRYTAWLNEHEFEVEDKAITRRIGFTDQHKPKICVLRESR
jgi:hypothetical protein